MDRHAPDGLRDDVDQAERDCLELIERWHGHDRLAYAVTVRFAPTSTPAQLAMAGALCRPDPTPVHADPRGREPRRGALGGASCSPRRAATSTSTHRAGLLHRAQRAGARHLARRRRPRAAARYAARRSRTARRRTCSSAAACSTGAPPKTRARRSAWPATSAAAPACRCSARWPTPTRCRPWPASGSPPGRRCTPPPAVRRARSGSGHEIGSFEPGRLADLCVWDWAVGPVAQRRMAVARDLHEQVFAWMTLSDPANLVLDPRRGGGALPARRPLNAQAHTPRSAAQTAG